MPTTINPIVMKFGGTSVEDANAFRRVCEIVRAQHAKARECAVVVIVSAMSKVTDALLTSVEAAIAGETDAATESLENQFERYRTVANELAHADKILSVTEAIDKARDEIAELLATLHRQPSARPLIQDVVVSYGERLSAMVLAATLDAPPAQYVDARRCIITDEEHGRATPFAEETDNRTTRELAPLLKENIIPILGGFIGSSLSGATTTLGRGGSDYSAALVGAALDAREIQIWTDVTGVMTADPRIVPRARTVPFLSYEEAAELAYFGAKVLHPKTIQPAIAKAIPVRVCNSRQPEGAGTLIRREADTQEHRVIKSIAHKRGITVVRVTAAAMLGTYGFMRQLFEVFERHRTPVDVVTTSEVSVSLTLDDTARLLGILEDLRVLGRVETQDKRAIICVVGAGILTTRGIATQVFRHLDTINISLISQGASSVNLTFVVDETRAAEVVRRLHHTFFETFGMDEAADLAARGEGELIR
ncbi:MAG: lysine-sensitive aspartokinase 3 [Pyrinomonadaceae bacterium MAG19_C2-C3]|nr:lysine-sensitive aspartokinase 3 [Pyrinomonadaceae bacterium MAG19_C2-C3]